MDRPLSCSIKNPVSLTLGTPPKDFQSGCKVIDVTFPNIINPEGKLTDAMDGSHIGEIRFKNFYVAYFSVKVKLRGDKAVRDAGDVKWKTCLKQVKLMPDPHSETSSQDYFSFTKKQFLCELNNVMMLRIILQQPSPVWKDFFVEDLKFFRSATGPKVSSLPAWLLEETTDKPSKKSLPNLASSKDTREGGVPDLEDLSAALQQLWALTEEASNSQTSQTLGRFEVDGCYDINLLAYT